MSDVYFQGQKLPPLREGNVWAMRIWPGGRLEVKQVKPEQIAKSTGDAIKELLNCFDTYVWLDDAAYVVQQWKVRKLTDQATSGKHD